MPRTLVLNIFSFNPIRNSILLLFLNIFLLFSNQGYSVTKTSTGNNWGTNNNWSPRGVPTSSDDVIINSNMSVSLNAVCLSLTVNNNRTLTINSTRSVTVGTDGVDNNGTILLVAGTSGNITDFNITGNLSNNNGGTLTATAAYTSVNFNGSSAQSFTNNGTVTSPLNALMLDNSSGLTLLGNNQIYVYQVNLSTGTISNSNRITLGTGGTSTCVVQVGSGSTSSPRGYFDMSPTFNLGTSGIQLIYTNASANYSTSFEIPAGGNNISYFLVATSNKTVSLQTDITITSSYATSLDLTSGNLSIGAHTLTMQGAIAAGSGTITGGTTSNITFSGNTSTDLPAVSGGLGILTFNTSATISVVGGVTVNGTLNLTSGTVSNQSNLTMASGTTIVRSGGSLINAPVFAGTVNLTYSGSSPITTGPELPIGAGVLNNLITNTGGVIQGSALTGSTNLLTDNFNDLNNWTGNIGYGNGLFYPASSNYAGGAPNETRYIYGSSSSTYYTNSIYRSVNTTGYSTIDIQWKQYINDYYGIYYPYVLRVQTATSPGGPWTEIYSLAPTSNTGPNNISFTNLTDNVGGTLYIRFLIEGYTWGINYWYFDDLIVNGVSDVSSTCTVNGTLNLTNGTYTIGSNNLVINGTKSGSNSIIGSTTSNLTIGGTGANLSLPTITNGLKNFTINRANGATLNNSVTVNQTLTLSNGALTIGANTLTLLGGITKTSGTLTGGSSSNITFAGSGASTALPSVSLNNLTINRSNGISLGGAVNVSGTLSLANGTLTVGANTLTLSGNSPTRTSGNINAGNAGATLAFTNTSAITLPASIFSGSVNNLTINGPGGITSQGDFTINGLLNLQSANPLATKGSLDMWDGSALRTLTMGANATTIGIGDVSGIVSRNSFIVNTPYTFGNQFTTINMAAGGVLPTSISCKITLTTNHAWKANAINRYYDIIQTGGNSLTKATLNLHYLDSELNGVLEGNMDLFDYHSNPGVVHDHGTSNNDIVNNWIGLANVSITYVAPYNAFSGDYKYWTMGTSTNANYTWLGAVDSDWYTTANWVGGVPGPGNHAIIPDANSTANDPLLPATATIGSILIQSGGIVNGGTGTVLTVDKGTGAWENRGTLNPGTSTIVFTNAAATMAGITNFNNVTVANGAGLILGTDNFMGIAGTLSLSTSGVLNAADNHNKVEYSGSNQTVVFPNGSTSGYHNLTLSGSGTKTMPGSNLNILGDFVIAGTATAIAASDIQVSGLFSIGNNTSFNTNSKNLSVGGNLTLNGTFTTTGSTVTLNGSLPQIINGSNSSVTFQGLTIQNPAGVTTNKNITINGELNLQSANPSSTAGALDMGIYTLLLGGSATNTGIGDVSGIVRRTALVPNVTYTFGNSYSTVIFNNSGTPPSEIQIKITLGSPPGWKTGAIDRYYEFVQIGGIDCYGDVSVHYLDAELGSNEEDKLVYWGGVFGAPMSIIEWGVSAVDVVNNSMLLVNVGINLWPNAFGIMEITIAQTEYPDLVWDGSESTVWDDPNNWTPIGFPDKHKTATIPDAATTPHDPILVPDAQIETLVLESGSILNALDNNTFSIYGTTDAWKNEGGTFNHGTGTVAFLGDGATMSGDNYFNNITVNSGATLIPAENNFMHVAGTFTNNGTLNANTNPNTIEYNGSNQPVIAPNGTDPGYYNLILSGSGTKTMPAVGFEIHKDFTLTGTVSATALNEMHTYGNLSIGSGTSLTTGPFEFHVGGNIVNDGTFINTGGLVCIDGNSPQTLSGIAPLTTFNILRVLNTNISGLTIDKNIIATNIIINSTGGITSNYSFDVGGEIDIRSPNPTATRGSLHMGSNTLNLGASATISSSSVGDITGIVKRATILPETLYSFNNYYSSIYFEDVGTLPTEMSVRLTIGAAPAWKPGAVQRIYEIAQTGAVYGDPAQATQAAIQSYYLDSELNGNDKNLLSNYSYINPPGIFIEHGRASHSETQNWISVVNVNIGFFPPVLGPVTVFIDESDATTYTWNGSVSSSWTTPGNWTPNGSPSFNSDVIIPDAATTPNDPVLNILTETKTLTIQSGGILNSVANAEYEIYGSTGAWNNNGTFNAGTSTVIFIKPGTTISGETNFYNVTIEPGAELIPQTDNIMHIAGTLLNEGTLDAVYYQNTIDYNGANQTVIIPSGLTPGYYNLILSGTGTKTMPASAFDVFNNFTISGTASATAVENITIGGSLNIASNAAFTTGSYIHSIAGNFINNGTFTSSNGNTIYMNGFSTQTISGTGALAFFDFETDNNSGVAIAANITVNNILALDDGTLTLGANSLTIAGQSPIRISGNIDASNSGATVLFTNSSVLTLPASVFTGNINNLTMNGAGGITLGSDATVSGNLVLTNGIITTGSNTFTVGENGSIAGGSTSSHINGKLARTFNVTGSKIFPVGKDGVFKPLTFEYTSLNGTSTVFAEQFETAMTGTLPTDTYLGPNRYWTVSQSGGTDIAYNVTLDASGYSYSPNYPKILLKDISIIALNASDAGSFFTSSGLTGFGDFALGETLAAPPTLQASDIVFSLVTANGFSITWTNGNGAGRAVFMKEESGIITNPVYGTVYTASNDWSLKGDQLGLSGYYCVYNGTGNNISVSGLSASTTYWVQVFDYNESGVTTSYLTTVSTNNPKSQLTLESSSSVEIADYKGWRMIASPRSTNYSDLLDGFVAQGVTGSTFPDRQPNLIWFDETETQTTNMSWRTVSSLSSTVTPGRGYYFYVFGDVPAESDYDDILPKDMTATGLPGFSSGVFNFFAPNHPVTYTPRTGGQTSPNYVERNSADAGWNLLGNPSAQTLDWDHSTGWTKTNVLNTIYVWDPSVPEWKIWNGSTGNKGDGKIPPFQAFWVKTDANPVLDFSDEVFTTGGTFLKSSDVDTLPSAIKISLETGGLQSTMFVSFNGKAVAGIDPWDAYFLEPLNNTWVELYSFSTPANDEPLSINNQPAPKGDMLNIPVFADGMREGKGISGNYTLRWELPVNWPDDWVITLQDNIQKTAVSMKNKNDYSFYHKSDLDETLTKSANNSQFKNPATIVKSVSGKKILKSGQPSAPFNITIRKGNTDIADGYIKPQPSLIMNYPNPFSSGTTIKFSLPEPENITLTVFDIVGRRIEEITKGNYKAGIHEIYWQNKNVLPGIYLVVLKTPTGTDFLKINNQL